MNRRYRVKTKQKTNASAECGGLGESVRKMKVAVVSDTHGCLSMLDRCIKLAGQVDAWCHLGDLTSDAEALMSRTNAKVYAVRGNCDYFGGSAQRYESEAVVELGGARILMMHGHTHGVSPYSYDKAAYRAEELHCSVLLFGHTHISIVNNDGRVLAVNPGSPSCPRGGRSPSFALLEIENGDVRAEIITM